MVKFCFNKDENDGWIDRCLRFRSLNVKERWTKDNVDGGSDENLQSLHLNKEDAYF